MEVDTGSGSAYSNRLHAAMARRLNEIADDALRAEISYAKKEPVTARVKGSTRMDVVYGDPNAPTAIFDYKVGGATMRPARQQRISRALPSGYEDVPIYVIKIVMKP